MNHNKICQRSYEIVVSKINIIITYTHQYQN